MENNPRKILQEYWGFDEFKGSQQTVIEAVLEGRDVMALMPTGGGKSICFQIPSLVKDGICIVISPLVALIQNQVDALKIKGIKAIALTGGIPYDEVNNLLDNCLFGKYKFLYLSPERLQHELILDRIQQMNVNLIAIDEAHCISQWGHDFRPAYLECSKLRDLLPDAPIIALTATATEQVAVDICDNLKLQEPLLIKDSFLRRNIAFKVTWKEDKLYHLKMLCAKVKKSAIVYVRTRRSAQELAHFLNKNDCKATYFHGGLTKFEKTERLESWLNDKVRIMVATNAFGMGIDKADVALVVHYQIPDCLENYFQEAGRAGRDDAPAQAVLLTNAHDENQVRGQFLSVLPDTTFIKLAYNKLNNYFQIPFGEGTDASFQFNLNGFCDLYGLNPFLTYNALRILDQNSVIALSEAFSYKSTVRFLAQKAVLFDYLEIHKKLAAPVQTILRTYGGIFDYDTKINTTLIAKKTALPETHVLDFLVQLHKDGIIAYKAQHNDLEISFLVPREDDRTINVFAKQVRERHRIKIEKVEQMLTYLKDDQHCRNRQLLAYFGEKYRKKCGVCDVCEANQGKSDPVARSVPSRILAKLEGNNLSSRALIAALPFEEDEILNALRNLLEDEKIFINNKNEYQIGTS